MCSMKSLNFDLASLNICIIIYQVHRLLLAAIGKEDCSQLLTNKQLDELSQHINNKHRVGTCMI